MTIAFVFFFGLVVALAVLPVVPAILEWRRPTDTAPLRVVQHSEVDIRFLANRFRTRVGEALAGPLAQCRATGVVQDGTLDGSEYRVVPAGDGAFLSEAEAGARRFDRMLLGSGDLRLPDELTLAKELYAEGSVTAGKNGVLRAVLAAGDVALGPGTRTLRWVHADGAVHLARDTRAHGRVSSDHVITLARDAEFERLRARRIEFGAVEPAPEPMGPRLLPRLEPGQLRPGTVLETDAGRWLVKGDCEVPPEVRVPADLVVIGTCRIGRGALVSGGLKTHGDLVLEEAVQVRGALVSQQDLHVGPGCRIEGPVIAERRLSVGPRVVVGDPDRPTTVSGLDLEIFGGTVIHGTVWAHRRGRAVGGSGDLPVKEAS